MPKRGRGKDFSWIWLVVAFALAGLGSLTIDRGDSLKSADPGQDILAYEALGVMLLALGIVAFFTAAMGGLDDGFSLSRSVASVLSWLGARNDELVARQALFSGVCGALGATLGWFAWVALAVLVAHPHDVWVSAVVGAAVGVTVDGARRYREIVRAGAADESARGDALTLPPKGEAGTKVSAHWFPVFGLGSTILGVLLGAASEESIGDLIKEVRLPFFFSLLTYAVGGMVIGAVARFSGGLRGTGWMGFMVLMLPGALLGLLLVLVDLLAGVRLDIESSAAWWAVITAVGVMAMITAEESTRRAVFTGVTTLCVIALLVVFTGLTQAEKDSAETRRHGEVRAVMHLAVSVSESMLKAPDIPETSWAEADAKLKAADTEELITPGVPPSVSRWLADVGGCDRVPAQSDPDHPQRFLVRKRELCSQLEAATGSSWARSAIVLLAFWIGLVTALRLEQRWRPEGYETHAVRRADGFALAFVALGLAAALLVVRLTG